MAPAPVMWLNDVQQNMQVANSRCCGWLDTPVASRYGGTLVLSGI
jgi:hypothetical protein